MSEFQIRNGILNDLEDLQLIECRAGAIFAEYAMDAIANDDPPSIDTLSIYCREHRLWVAVDLTNHPIAYIIVDVVDNAAHIEQVSVDPDHSGKRIGQLLIDTVGQWGKTHDLRAITLTTFRDVPWNAPYYQRLGFQVVPDEQQTPGLKRIRAEEHRHGLDQWPRVCMTKPLYSG